MRHLFPVLVLVMAALLHPDVAGPAESGPRRAMWHGAAARGFSSEPVLSANGRFVVFISNASNLVARDRNGVEDVFLHDRVAGTTELVSVSSGGRQGNGDVRGEGWNLGRSLAVTADGRFVAFVSYASNLVANDTNSGGIGNDCPDVFVRDRVARTTERVNVSSSGTQAEGEFMCSGQPSISANGRFVAFWSSANLVAGDRCSDALFGHCADVFVHDRKTGGTERVSVSSTGKQANGSSWRPRISAGGRYVFFESGASNLVGGRKGGGVFMRDLQTRKTTLVHKGAYGFAISPNSRFLAFVAPRDGRPAAFILDRAKRTTELTTHFPQAMSADGRFVAFVSTASNLAPGRLNTCTEYKGDGSPRGTYTCPEVFVHDRARRKTQRIGVTSAGQPLQGEGGNPSMSASGRFVAFRHDRNVYVRDLRTDTTTLVSAGH